MPNVSNLTVVQGRLGVKWEARVTAKQEAIILRVSGKHGLTHDDLMGYVSTGDASYMSGDTASKITEIVKAVKTQLPESAAKRIWPRKVASVLLTDSISR